MICYCCNLANTTRRHLLPICQQGANVQISACGCQTPELDCFPVFIHVFITWRYWMSTKVAKAALATVSCNQEGCRSQIFTKDDTASPPVSNWAMANWPLQYCQPHDCTLQFPEGCWDCRVPEPRTIRAKKVAEQTGIGNSLNNNVCICVRAVAYWRPFRHSCSELHN